MTVHTVFGFQAILSFAKTLKMHQTAAKKQLYTLHDAHAHKNGIHIYTNNGEISNKQMQTVPFVANQKPHFVRILS